MTNILINSLTLVLFFRLEVIFPLSSEVWNLVRRRDELFMRLLGSGARLLLTR
jgi:hypothetical protein